MSIGTFHQPFINGEHHGGRHFRTGGSNGKNTADWKILICFYFSIEEIFHFKIIGNSITDSLCGVNNTSPTNGKKEIYSIFTTKPDAFFYVGKSGIGNGTGEINKGKSGIRKALVDAV